ncbi:MAG: hypothetical protein AB7E42_10830 [Anaerotignaceae bacterium]
MAQVNIDVAKEASVQAVNTKVGTSSDTASSTPTTVFAGIKGLIAWFTGVWTAARAGYVDTINANTAVNNTANKTGTLSQKESYGIGLLENGTYGLSALKTAIASNFVVKSVQRLTITSTEYASTISLNISTVTPSKCIVLIDGIIPYSGIGYPPFISSFTSSTITFSCGQKFNSGNIFSCQILEYY